MTEYNPSAKNKGEDKFRKIPTKLVPKQLDEPIKKPSWIRIKAVTSPNVAKIKKLLRKNNLHSVCEEASCPNLNECFSKGTATFMIMGDKCTRRCTFCDVAHGRPDALDENEPKNLAKALVDLKLKYIVITSVDRDDLKDGGAEHFANCIKEIRKLDSNIKIEVLVPDFRGRKELAIEKLSISLPDIFNHNLETVPRLYKTIRIGANYQHSLDLIKEFKQSFPQIPTKSGLMIGLGETLDEIKVVLEDLKAHGCDMITLGQYLQPSKFHAPVVHYATPEEFYELKVFAESLGFVNVASGPLVRSSYHADLQASGEVVK